MSKGIGGNKSKWSERLEDLEDPCNNQATVTYLASVAAAERQDIYARLGNPTRCGPHAKPALVSIGGEMWLAVLSKHCGEVGIEVDREVGLRTV